MANPQEWPVFSPQSHTSATPTHANDAALVGFFGRATSLRAITAVRADDFLSHYQTREPKLASATIARRIKMARMLLKHAEKLKLIPVNPFADVTAKNGHSEARQHYITREETQQLIDAANPVWRTIIALARFAGLRCPSEVLSLKWENVDFAKKRMTVSSPKTEHLEGKAYRIVPIFADLRPHLEDAFELAEPGEVYVVGGEQGHNYRKTTQKRGGWNSTNLRTTFGKLIRRVGLKPWPRPFHNLRASALSHF